jgi:hypothetical protein
VLSVVASARGAALVTGGVVTVGSVAAGLVVVDGGVTSSLVVVAVAGVLSVAPTPEDVAGVGVGVGAVVTEVEPGEGVVATLAGVVVAADDDVVPGVVAVSAWAAGRASASEAPTAAAASETGSGLGMLVKRTCVVGETFPTRA